MQPLQRWDPEGVLLQLQLRSDLLLAAVVLLQDPLGLVRLDPQQHQWMPHHLQQTDAAVFWQL